MIRRDFDLDINGYLDVFDNNAYPLELVSSKYIAIIIFNKLIILTNKINLFY